MTRILLALILLIGFASTSSATWVSGTIAVRDKTPDGQLVVVVVFTDDVGSQDKASFVVKDGTLTALVQSELIKRNAASKDATDVPVGTVITAAGSDTKLPTAEDIAFNAFAAKVNAWMTLRGKASISPQFGAVADVIQAAMAIMNDYEKASDTLKARYDSLLAGVARIVS